MGWCETSGPAGMPSTLSVGAGTRKMRLYQGVVEGGVYHWTWEGVVHWELGREEEWEEAMRERMWR